MIGRCAVCVAVLALAISVNTEEVEALLQDAVRGGVTSDTSPIELLDNVVVGSNSRGLLQTAPSGANNTAPSGANNRVLAACRIGALTSA